MELDNAFNWHGRPSALRDDPAFNGINHARSLRSAGMDKKTVRLAGSSPTLHRAQQITAYGRAVLAKTQTAYGLDKEQK